ncbi:hypothetical protein GGQ01_001226 [Salinibacter ruber]|uniref:Uncharacterized protein n=1 Tax=Salinibacter ruber TaxID=146919 RepID=A0A9X2UK01_9BACT|nr:hypothetical protein [Salinibacter ruber]
MEVHRRPAGTSYAEITVHTAGETVSLRDRSIAAADLLP